MGGKLLLIETTIPEKDTSRAIFKTPNVVVSE